MSSSQDFFLQKQVRKQPSPSLQHSTDYLHDTPNAPCFIAE